MFVELFGRALEAVVGLSDRGMPWCEVPKQCPGPAVLFAGGRFAVQMKAALEILVHSPHQSIEHVAGAVAIRMIKSQRPQLLLATQVQDFVLNDTRQRRLCPYFQDTNSLRATAFVGSPENVPYSLTGFEKQFAQMLAAITNLQPRMQKALQNNDHRKQRFPDRHGLWGAKQTGAKNIAFLAF